MNWIERAEREIPNKAVRATANSAERNPKAVMAVPAPGQSEFSQVFIDRNNGALADGSSATTAAIQATVPMMMTPAEECAIRGWLAHIGETDPATVAAVLEECRSDTRERDVVIGWAEGRATPSSR